MKRLISFILLFTILLFTMVTVTGCESSMLVVDQWDTEKKAPTDNFSKKSETSNTETEKAFSINPFDGIAYEISGISPYCQIHINNSKCSDEAQKYVIYSLDKTYYSNGESAVITAKLSSYTGDEKYMLTSSESTYRISDQPEYITSTDGVDMTFLKQELNDYITANVSSAIRHGQEGYYTSSLLGNAVACELQSVGCVDPADIYFSSKKPNKISNATGYFNILSCTYKVSYTGKYDSGTFYSCITAVNIIKYPDGTIKWGSKNSDDFDFIAYSADGSIENCVTTLIMSNSDNYNISKIILNEQSQ